MLEVGGRLGDAIVKLGLVSVCRKNHWQAHRHLLVVDQVEYWRVLDVFQVVKFSLLLHSHNEIAHQLLFWGDFANGGAFLRDARIHGFVDWHVLILKRRDVV